MNTLYENPIYVHVSSRWIITKMRNISDKFVEKIKTRISCSEFFSENRVICEVMWKIMVQPDTTQMTIWRMHFECWTTKATDTHSKYVIPINFPRQQCLPERASMLSYTYITYTVWY